MATDSDTTDTEDCNQRYGIDDLRIEALRSAVQHMSTCDPVGTAICAEVFFDFLMGKSRKIVEEPKVP